MLARRCDRQERLDALNDEAYLPIVVVAVAGRSQVACCGDALARGFVGEITANFGCEFVEGGEEDGLFVFFEALKVTCGALSEEETAAAGDLEALWTNSS